jgi:hypothetical protein
MPASRSYPRARLSWLALAAMIVATLAACTLKSGGYNTDSPPKMRFFNASPDMGAVDATAGGLSAASVLGYEQFSTYRPLTPGQQTITITPTGGTRVIAESTQDLQNGDRFAYILFGRPTAPRTLFLTDRVDLPGSNDTKVRFVNVTAEQAALDLYITDPGQSLDTVAPLISGVTAGAASDFIERNAGSSEVRITPAGSKAVLFDSGQVTFSGRNAYTLVAYDRGDPGQVNVGVLTNDTLGSGSLLNSIFSSTRLLNAAPGVPAVSMTMDQLTFAGISYDTISRYAQSQSGARTATFVPTASPGTTLLSTSLLLPPGGASTTLLFGAPGAVQALTVQDFNLPPQAPGNARVRVVNAGSGTGNVSTLLNGSLAVGALASGLSSLYFEVAAASYDFTFVDPTSQAVLLSVPGVALGANHTYTLFLVGQPGQLTSLLTQDR